jgi:hypothetical protein
MALSPNRLDQTKAATIYAAFLDTPPSQGGVPLALCLALGLEEAVVLQPPTPPGGQILYVVAQHPASKGQAGRVWPGGWWPLWALWWSRRHAALLPALPPGGRPVGGPLLLVDRPHAWPALGLRTSHVGLPCGAGSHGEAGGGPPGSRCSRVVGVPWPPRPPFRRDLVAAFRAHFPALRPLF